MIDAIRKRCQEAGEGAWQSDMRYLLSYVDHYEQEKLVRKMCDLMGDYKPLEPLPFRYMEHPEVEPTHAIDALKEARGAQIRIIARRVGITSEQVEAVLVAMVRPQTPREPDPVDAILGRNHH